MPDFPTRNLGRSSPRFVLVTCLLLFITFTSLYLIIPPDLAFQPWDSLEYAYSMETEGIQSIRGNHPLGHVLSFMVFTLAKQLGYDGRALTISQVTNGILGGLVIAIFFPVLVFFVKVRMLSALGFSLLLGASHSFWFFAGTGDIYHVSILLSLLAWATLIYEITLEKRPAPILPGILTGLSILCHQLNALLVPASLALILLSPGLKKQTRNENIKQISIFLGASSAVALLGYLLLGFMATSSLSLARVVGWMRGYFGDPTYGRYLDSNGLKTAWLTVTQAVMYTPEEKAEYISQVSLVVLGIVMCLGFLFNKAFNGRKRAIMIASALGCLITWLLILWWEPQNPKFWLLTFIPGIIILALSLEAVEIRIRNRLPMFGVISSYIVRAVPFLMGIFLLSINLQYNASRPGTATFHRAMDTWLEHSNPEDVIITAGDLVPQLRFWGRRPNTVYLYRSLQASQTSAYNFDDLQKEINRALCAHHTVLITPAASEYVPANELSLVGVTREELRSYLYENAHNGKIAFWYRNVLDGKLLPVYELSQPVSCSERKSVLDFR